MNYTPEELMVVCMARQLKDEDIAAQGIATPMVTAAYLLAKRTHAPHLYFASAIGQGICREPAEIGLTRIEALWLDRSLVNIGFTRASADILPTLRPKEFFRPAQVDLYGNFNNIAFGKQYLSSGKRHPRLRMPGSGGIPDVTTYYDDIYLYVPRHSRVTFVPQLDVRSGLGNSPERTHGHGPQYLVSNLGQFAFIDGKMHLQTYHPGVPIDTIKAHTGFELCIAQDCHETEPPTHEEITLLRTEIDPLGIRNLEILSGNARRELIHRIVALES